MDDEERWRAVRDCDPAWDGRFFYGVKTTGIYCRPSCRSRLPGRQNIRYFPSARAAEEAGYRPCKRCRPDLAAYRPEEELARAAAGWLEEHLSRPDALRALPGALGVNGDHLRALFRRQRGETPAAFLARRRVEAACRALKKGDAPVLQVSQAVGFASLSAFYAAFRRQVGLSPGQYRQNTLSKERCL
ncbi:methylphosphotriester-DNA--protein-cysteine methyltransferase family protein [Bittarella massiliensis]|uniref:bifunctional transcriptional activator/DNA repair enzyme AdaA n=1 Tax=Bittarella massiliensis (ex Durand et al. 2017) TaxID=1720313 RepID=UPI00163C3530|nr:Ada metal-binding domain-containing protein [Bittarella massiliensis (ex Durand et al. 2017)]MBC2872294.1 methylphosphotriester-DNA--protein-cysteine methyltransferase family protein [Bittarella massiliensis (ex Durand et al. 2017)]